MRSKEKTDDWLPILPPGVATQIYQAIAALEGAALGDRFAVGFASCNHGAGTSTIAWQFAQAFAASGTRAVCLVEANCRTPRLAQAVGLRPGPGLADLMQGRADLETVVQRPGGGKAHVITAGITGPEGASMLDRATFGPLLQRIRARFPVILFDMAPVLPYPDTAALARLLDGTVLVLRTERDKREVAQQAVRVLAEPGARVIGVVLNRKPLHIPQWLYKLL